MGIPGVTGGTTTGADDGNAVVVGVGTVGARATVGSGVGSDVGARDAGGRVGALNTGLTGGRVGALRAGMDGALVGAIVGALVGLNVGVLVGLNVGVLVGLAVIGAFVGL